MVNVASKTVYFENSGPKNTDDTINLAKERAEELGLRNVIIATTAGETAVKASKIFKEYNLVVVTHVTGFTEPEFQQLTSSNRKILQENGVKIITSAHAFGTLGRAINKKFGAIQVDGIISSVFRLFSQGLKVACEISCMVADAGVIRTDEDVVAIGGSGSGADTAVILKPSNTHAFFDMRLKEIICKPLLDFC